MSSTEAVPDELACGASRFTGVLHPRDVPLGGPRAIRVRRTLPQRERSLIGAWCFVDHFGPRAGIPATVRPGELNLMTAGAGICHSELSNPRSAMPTSPATARNGSNRASASAPSPVSRTRACLRHRYRTQRCYPAPTGEPRNPETGEP